jgi:hypothetical protein
MFEKIGRRAGFYTRPNIFSAKRAGMETCPPLKIINLMKSLRLRLNPEATLPDSRVVFPHWINTN